MRPRKLLAESIGWQSSDNRHKIRFIVNLNKAEWKDSITWIRKSSFGARLRQHLGFREPWKLGRS